MLKINKILSKKIKFPLSLRGTKQRSNLKGFSLIELMVAVVILAIAVLGIFFAFSNTWMGMANARDRTVATNYAREAMEDVKNMDFELVTNVNLGTAESVGTKFTRVITVNTESDNLKKIDTKVFWTNRQGQYVSVEPSMYISRTLLNPGAASRIMLYADPYYTVLPTLGTANIIAVIKDIDGNTKIDWTGGDIRFEITGGSGSGYLPDGVDPHFVTFVTPTNGRADIIFTGTAEGEVVIEASIDLPSGGTASNTITIRVTLDVVRIDLSAVPDKMEADGATISIVTAKLVNSGDGIVTDASNEITFNISGEGIFVVSEEDRTPLGSSTVSMTPVTDTGTATIYVESIADTPGVATVTASSDGLLSGTVNIITTGVATTIFVSVVPDLIYIDDPGARVTVEIQDINGNPVKYTNTINISTSDDTGSFIPVSPLNFADTSSVETTFSSTSPGIVTITASGGGLAAGNATIDVREALIADTITLKAIPKNILAGGEADSEITATIKDGSIVISNYSNDVTFEIILDTSSLQDAELYFNGTIHGGLGEPFTVTGEQYGDDGEVELYLEPASDVGICTIRVSTDNLVDPDLIVNTIEVGFYSSEDHIDLSAVPPEMLVDGENCTVTAIVVDEGGTPVTTYNGDITFTILVGWPKIAKFVLTGTSSLTTTLVGGTISVGLIPQSIAGTVTLKASSFTGMTDITGYLNIQVVASLLELAPVPNISYGENQVSFDIEVQGIEINLVEMQVSWDVGNPVETLDKIDIAEDTIYDNDPIDPVGSIVYTDNLNERVADIDVTDTTLSTDIYTITMYFDTDMSGKTFGVIFNPNSGNYSITITEPTP